VTECFRGKRPLLDPGMREMCFQCELNRVQHAIERGMKQKWLLRTEPYRGITEFDGVIEEIS
jgi:hypothetical protein